MKRTMANKKNWLGILVMVLVFGMTVVGCGGNRLNGTWVLDMPGSEAQGILEWSFNKGHFERNVRGYENNHWDGTYTTNGNSLIITDDNGKPWTYTYSVSGNTFTLKDEEGDITIFTRKQESTSKSSGGGSSKLVGKWVPESGQRVPSDFIERRIELLKDGTGIGDGYSLAWSTEKSRVIFKLDIGRAFAYDYQVSGATLILTNDDGASVRYTKE